MLQAYACAVSLIPQAAWMGSTIEDRHKALESIGELASKAAAAAVQCSQPDLALEWLEQGRSVVWGQTLQLRSPIDILRERDPTLAKRLTEISRALESNSETADWSEESGRQLRGFSLEWEAILTEVRKLDGFEDFLGPKKVAQLLPAASVCPVVVLNAHEDGCDALVLMADAGEVIHIPLSFTSKRALQLVDSLANARYGRSLARHPLSNDRHLQINRKVKESPDQRIRGLLAELWNSLVKPVLEALALSVSSGLHA